MTIDDWLEIKDRIRKELNNVKHSFVRVGFYLRKVRDEKLYLQDGYSSLSEFAKAEYNMSASFVSRMISINEKFSLDGYSEQMDPRFEDFRQGALTEMLALPDSDMEMVTPATPREDIRELKRFNAQEPAAEPAGDEHTKILEVVEEFCRQDRQLISDLYEYTVLASTAERDLIEMINPSGSRTFKKGLYFVSFTDAAVKIKKFMKPPQSMTYQEFVSLIAEVLGPEKSDSKWEDHFGEPESNRKPEENVQKAEQSVQKPKENAQKPKGNAQKQEKTHEERKEDRAAGEKHAEDGSAAGDNIQEHGEPDSRDDESGKGSPGERNEDACEDRNGGKPGQEHEQEHQEAGGLGEGDLECAGGPAKRHEVPEGEQEEPAAQEGHEAVESPVAPAQIEGMNPPEKQGKEYDMEVINTLLSQIQESIENHYWLSAETHCTELAAYLARCRGGGLCS